MILKNTIKKKLSQDLTIEQVNTIEGELISGKTLTEIFSEKNPYQVSLQKFYAMLKRNKELEIKIIEARKMGMQTLIDKIMTLLQTEEITDPNLILWLRERINFGKWTASKITDLYSDNKPQKVNTDQKISIAFEDNLGDMIDISGEIEEVSPTPPKN